MGDSAELPYSTIEIPSPGKIANRLDFRRSDTATPTDQARAAADPVRHILGLQPLRAGPGPGCWVPAFAAVGIDNGRLATCFAGATDQRVCLRRVDAIDSDCHDLLHIAG